MNRKNSIIGLASLLLIGCSQGKDSGTIVDESSYTLNCNFTEFDVSKAYLSEFVGGKIQYKDSIDVVDGKFTFTGELDFPEVCFLGFDDKKGFIPVFIENTDISISGTSLNRDSVEVKGSSLHDALDKYNKEQKAFYTQFDELYDKYGEAEKKGDTVRMNEIDVEYDKMEVNLRDYITNFTSDNSSSVIAPYIFASQLMHNLKVNEIDSVLSTFSKDLDSSKYVVILRERYEKLDKIAVGKEAPMFTQNDENGKPISLSDFKGKYVLIDFWASWCGPCRKENPNVVEAYKKYHDKGFEILGVSFDDTKEKWLAAIEKDNLTWTHVSDLKGWSNEVGQIYAVNSIPHSVLINPEGVIIAKNLRGDELHTKLEEVLNSEL